ncbi:MAG: peptide deformylase [Alphaproteobacteria bacterium]|nr:peptide deformylase [Alphaproteobacteria bacterium]
MSILKIIKVPDAVLKEVAQPITQIDMDVRRLAADMLETMAKARGVGLAANQVNVTRRLVVVCRAPWRIDSEENGVKILATNYRKENGEEVKLEPIVMINPEVIWKSDDQSSYLEGCLSLPEQFADIIRPYGVRIKFTDIHGTQQEELFEGFDAHCAQHEIDHINGVLFVDYLSKLKRDTMIKKVIKAEKLGETAL